MGVRHWGHDVDVSQVAAQLARAPAVLNALVGPLPQAWLDATEGPGTWSPIQVVRHMAWCEVDDWIPRARIILEHGARVPFTPFDREGGESRFGHLPIGALLDEFARLRSQNLETLEQFALGPETLGLEGRHPELGRVTLAQLLATWVAHDLSHITQITRTLTRQHRDAVGPWRRYMRLLSDDAAV